MATSASEQLYPFSSEDSKAIPLEVIRPLGVYVLSLSHSGNSIVIPAEWQVVSVISSVDAIWTFDGDSIALDAVVENALFMPEHTMLTVAIPPDAVHFIQPVHGAGGRVSIQGIQRWAGLGLQRQLVRR